MKFERTPAGDLLATAKEQIERHGWTQFRTSDEHGRLCMMGGIGVAIQMRGQLGYKDAILSLGRSMDVGTVYSIPSWNDAPERTKEQVLAAFDCAIAAETRVCFQ